MPFLCYFLGNGGFTFTYDALELAGDVLVPQSRPDANLFVLLFTDGESNGMEGATAYTIQVANQVKSMRAMKMIAVGVGVSIILCNPIRYNLIFWCRFLEHLEKSKECLQFAQNP